MAAKYWSYQPAGTFPNCICHGRFELVGAACNACAARDNTKWDGADEQKNIKKAVSIDAAFSRYFSEIRGKLVSCCAGSSANARQILLLA